VVAAWEFRKASSPYFFISLGFIKVKLSGLVWIRGGSFWSLWVSTWFASLPSSYFYMYSLLGDYLFDCGYYFSLVSPQTLKCFCTPVYWGAACEWVAIFLTLCRAQSSASLPRLRSGQNSSWGTFPWGFLHCHRLGLGIRLNILLH
jgi:hypothetical protein